MKRLDRSEKLKERKLYRETIVKSALKKFVSGEADRKEALVSSIENRVSSFSKAINFASISLCGLLKEIFHEKDVETVEVPEVFDATFVRQLMLGTENAHKPFDEIREYHTRYPFLMPQVPRYLGDRNIYSHGATQFVTNFKNSVVSNFEGRIKQYLKVCQETFKFSKDEKVLAFYKIMGWKIPFKLETKEIENQELLALIQKQRNILNLTENEKVGPRWLKKEETLKNIVKQWVVFNRFYESIGVKQFILSPIASIRPKFITIDTQVLFGLYQELRIGDQNEAAFQEDKESHWNSMFKIAKILKRTSKDFTFTVNTDGTSLCTHLRQLKSTESIEEVLFDEEKDRILSCDPGRVNIFTIVEKIFGTDEWKSYVLTRKQYYNDSGVFEARENAEKWHKCIKEQLEALSKVTLKGVCLESHNRYLDTFMEVQEDLWFEYTKNRWARQRLELYGGKKRVFARFFNTIKRAGDSRKEIKMLFGAAKFAPGAPNELSVPTSRAFRECVARFITKLVNEFRTSKIHYETDEVLEGIQNKIYKRVNQENTIKSKRPIIGKKSNDSLRGLLWYRSTIQNESKFIDRDINAAKNIYRCGMLPKRPEILCRTKDTKKLEVVIGKTIRTLLYL